MLQTPEKRPEAIERSYTLLSLLTVCEHCADHIECGMGENANHRRAASALSNVLALAQEIAGEVHDVLELSKREARSC